MTIRNATVKVDVTGGTVDNSNSISQMMGVQKTVEISQEDDGATTSGVRMIIGADDAVNSTTRLTGESVMTLTPPADGEYSVSVDLKSYTLYGLFDTCQSPVVSCERTIDGADAEDEFSGNNFDSIYGSATTVHDITLFEYYLSQPVDDSNEEEGDSNVDSYGFIGGEISETLSTGTYDMYAVVMHTSSSEVPIYEWNVTFE